MGIFLAFIILFHNLNAICNANKKDTERSNAFNAGKDFSAVCKLHFYGMPKKSKKMCPSVADEAMAWLM